jgi:hypothetical protein
MARTYLEMLPLWYVQEQLALSDQYVTGLAWKTAARGHQSGDMAGRQHGKYCYVSLCGNRYQAHRIVYYLRTGDDPGNADVVHDPSNATYDNREALTLKQRKARPTPSYRRRTRNSEGELVYSLEDGMSFNKYQRLIGASLHS